MQGLYLYTNMPFFAGYGCAHGVYSAISFYKSEEYRPWETHEDMEAFKLSHATMAHIIRNPKYKGYFCGNKVGTEDMFTKKMVFKPESEWVMFKDECIVPAI